MERAGALWTRLFPFKLTVPLSTGRSKELCKIIHRIPNQDQEYAGCDNESQSDHAARLFLLLELTCAGGCQVQIKIQVKGCLFRRRLTVILKAFVHQLLGNRLANDPVTLQILHTMIDTALFHNAKVHDIALPDFLEEVIRQAVDHTDTGDKAKNDTSCRMREHLSAIHNVLAIQRQSWHGSKMADQTRSGNILVYFFFGERHDDLVVGMEILQI